MQATQTKSEYSLEHRGFVITVKKDFGGEFFLIDGMPCSFGYVVTKAGANVIPGAGWFQTVKDAKLAIDCWVEAAEDSQVFHQKYRRVKAAQTSAHELLSALEAIKEKQAWVTIQGAGAVRNDVEVYKLAESALAKFDGYVG